MLQNDLFAAGTGTGPSKSSMPRAVALERSALAFSCELALVIQGSATATRTNVLDGSPIWGQPWSTQRGARGGSDDLRRGVLVPSP